MIDLGSVACLHVHEHTLHAYGSHCHRWSAIDLGELVRSRRVDVHTNTIEGYFSIFKRGMKGGYQHCGQSHLNRCLAEFDFRYNNRTKLGVDDNERTINALKDTEGKRRPYRQSPDQAE